LYFIPQTQNKYVYLELRSNPFLEPTSTEHAMKVKYLAKGNN